MSSSSGSFISPGGMPARYGEIMREKMGTSTKRLLARAVMAGVVIALTCVGATALYALLPYAVARVAAAAMFPAGLAMVLIMGGELFTGNSLLTLGLLTGDVRPRGLLRNWGVVYLGNFIGSLLVASLVAVAYRADAAFLAALRTAAETRAALTWLEAFVRAILCNVLVCAAVWMAYTSSTVPGKLMALYAPVMLFVLAGMEHCVTNMYYFMAPLLAGAQGDITWATFLLGNLLPVTLGNIVGGAVVCAGMLWLSLFEGRGDATFFLEKKKEAKKNH
ncbi:formate/nitrite transporter family protein [Eubacteriales bacterium OttesenSCG-928-A19]|nr:formate/nitrite transporter family protein [Eubacteriales bacterium OttesenSCG-928-A19]